MAEIKYNNEQIKELESNKYVKNMKTRHQTSRSSM